jgi:hypothetical protein
MRIEKVTLTPLRSHREPTTRSVTQSTAAITALRIFVTLILLTGVAIAPRAAKADITYTWHEDDGQNVTGALLVQTAAQAAGQIMSSDVESYSFNIGSLSNPFTNLDPDTFPIPISKADAAPTAQGWKLDSTPLLVSFDTQWNVISGETFSVITGPHEPAITGSGHWSISVAMTAVPEPSTALVASLGAVAFIAYGWSRHRREQRRQAAA